MGLYRYRPPMSGRMGTLWTLASVRDAALIEYGCMGHMMYGRVFLSRAGVSDGCKLYSTHLSETDISLGNTSRLDRTVREVIETEGVNTVFFLPSSVPAITGIDLEAVCEELNFQYPDIRMIAFGAEGFEVHGERGVEEALLKLVKKLPQKRPLTEMPSFNLIGSCADMFRFDADARELVRILKGAFDMDPVCIMTSDTSVSQIEAMAGAHINLVIRREGEAAAKHLEKTYNTPYLLKRPYGIEGTLTWIDSIAESLGKKPDWEFLNQEKAAALKQTEPALPLFRHMIQMHPDHTRLSLGSHPDVVEGILSFGVNELSFTKGECWSTVQLKDCGEVPYYTETMWISAVKRQKEGILMTSGEALKAAGANLDMQIANPDVKWRLNPYEPPFMGFRGAVNLINLWVNEEQLKKG